MNRVVVKSTVGKDGVLHLDVPIGEADQEVQVTIEPVRQAASNEEWQEFITRTAGAWQGELERPEQGEYEQRDELN